MGSRRKRSSNSSSLSLRSPVNKKIHVHDLIHHRLLIAIKHEIAAIIRVIASQLTSSKMAENLISCRSHRVDIQKLIPSTIPIKISININFLSPQTPPPTSTHISIYQHKKKTSSLQTTIHIYSTFFRAVLCDELRERSPSQLPYTTCVCF